MALSLVTAPATEPVSVAEAKLQCRVDYSDEDVLLMDLVTSGREWVEAFVHRALITQTWDLTLDAFPCDSDDPVWLPLPPLQSVTHVKYYDTTGTLQTWSSSLYTVVAPSGPMARMGYVVPAYQQIYPTTRAVPDAVTVRFVCGYGTDSVDVPASLRQAIKMRVLDLWETGRASTVVGNIVSAVPNTLNALLWPYKAF